jgi:uncharacterized protein (TIGR02646 family)
MIKLEKDTAAVPTSLIPAFNDLFASVTIPRQARTTHERRMSVIGLESYTDDEIHNSRYKKGDIKAALNEIYHGKCAFCEQLVEQTQVEHYRPKSIYYWLAFSWDNLILACPRCNQGKGIHFDIRGERAYFENDELHVRSINNRSVVYDASEQPLMVNPEVTDPLGMIAFQRDGTITSENERFAYTIEKCAIDRNYLNDLRRKLLDDFARDVESVLVENDDVEQQRNELGVIIKKFIRDARDVKNPFLAFRRFAIGSDWLNEITKEQSN